jgi:hypothetical protein
MSETAGSESRDYWFHNDNQRRWTAWSTDREAMDRSKMVLNLRAPLEPRSQRMAEGRMVPHGPRIERAQEALSTSPAETKASEAVELAWFQVEPAEVPIESTIGDERRWDASELPLGGISNQMRISPYRCALCDRRFCINGKKKWQWTRCGGGVWHPGIPRYYHCRAWLCRFDDECPGAGKPCPCCKKIKRLEISDQSKPRGSSSSHSPAICNVDAPDPRDDDCVAVWYDEQGVCHSLHEV